jgi:acyl carrier protein
MREEEIKNTILTVLRKTVSEADLEKLSPDENLRKALDIDSFDFLNIIIAIHDALRVDIPESDYGKLSTLSAMLDYLAERIS